MKLFDWNDDKNEWLLRTRRVTFEEVVFHITHGGLLDIVDHPNAAKYPGQRMFVVEMEGYVYLVPFVEDGDTAFLKTIFPSRRKTREYLEGDQP